MAARRSVTYCAGRPHAGGDVNSGAARRMYQPILDFWFAPGRERQWFRRDPAFDSAVRETLGADYERAARGGFADWRSDPEGCVALCILLDQVPRNLFRGAPRAFATDEMARAVTRHALTHGLDRDLPAAWRLFLYLPLEHSESLSDQDACVRLCEALDGPSDWAAYARAHRDVIARFGRFPHRNAALGRASTPAEAAFLAEPGSSF